MSKKEEMYSSWQGDSELQSEKVNNMLEIEQIGLNELKGFKNHPFKVETNRELFELMQSIERDGILVPLLARPSPDGNGYELISGHRRKAACEWAGITEVPVIICDMDDNQATIAMVNSNLQREHVRPSEKAFAFKMRLDAMKRQGERSDLTSSQLGTKLDIENPTVEINKLELHCLQWGRN
jgi:ParB-like partition proteins